LWINSLHLPSSTPDPAIGGIGTLSTLLAMHQIQEKLLDLVKEEDVSQLTLRQIAKLVGEKHPQKIKHHLNQLEKKGMIDIDWHSGSVKRNSRRADKNSSFQSVPIIGLADCGQAITFAEETFEGYLKVSRKILDKIRNIFAVQAKGNSMNKAKINGQTIEDGDYVVIDSSDKDPFNGDYVLAVVDNFATIKRFYRDRQTNRIVLLAESTEEYLPIYLHEDDSFMINGIVKFVLKKPKINF